MLCNEIEVRIIDLKKPILIKWTGFYAAVRQNRKALPVIFIAEAQIRANYVIAIIKEEYTDGTIIGDMDRW